MDISAEFSILEEDTLVSRSEMSPPRLPATARKNSYNIRRDGKLEYYWIDTATGLPAVDSDGNVWWPRVR